MHDTILSSGRDTFLIAIPFLGLLLAALFRLDERFAAPKKVRRAAPSTMWPGPGRAADPLRSRWQALG